MHQDSLDYSIIQFNPNPERMETVNIGIVVFTENGLILRFSKNMEKITALDANIS